jgi:hypothetical protein
MMGWKIDRGSRWRWRWFGGDRGFWRFFGARRLLLWGGRVCFGCDRLSIFGICEHGQNAPLPYSLCPQYFRCVTAIDSVSFLVKFVVAATHTITTRQLSRDRNALYHSLLCSM